MFAKGKPYTSCGYQGGLWIFFGGFCTEIQFLDSSTLGFFIESRNRIDTLKPHTVDTQPFMHTEEQPVSSLSPTVSRERVIAAEGELLSASRLLG